MELRIHGDPQFLSDGQIDQNLATKAKVTKNFESRFTENIQSVKKHQLIK